jgi:hypothetical protein
VVGDGTKGHRGSLLWSECGQGQLLAFQATGALGSGCLRGLASHEAVPWGGWSDEEVPPAGTQLEGIQFIGSRAEFGRGHVLCRGPG